MLSCSGSPGSGLDLSVGTSVGTGGEDTSGTTEPTTAGPSATDGTTAGSTGSAGGPKFDVGTELDIAGGTGGAVPPSCSNIHMFPETSVGCVFYTAQVPSRPSPLPYGISVGNPTMEVATIVIEDMRGPGGTLREITSFQLQPKASQLTAVNGRGGVLDGENHMIPAYTFGLFALSAFRITSDVPVTAMQLFPVGGGPSHVSEASLLLPVNALGTSYLGLGYGPGFTVVVATEDATTVTTDQGDVMLDAFDVWHYHDGVEATGFFVGSDKPVAVLSGVECVMIPGHPLYACDHIEEMLVPLASWGKEYVAPRHPHRVPNLLTNPEEVYWRVMSAVDNMTVTLDPPVAGVGGQINLAQVGELFEFSTTESFTATSDEPFMLVQYMSGCFNVISDTDVPQPCQVGPTGDPYMIQVVPKEQWLTGLPFLTDTSYPRDFVMLMREAGTEITLECMGVVPADHFTAIPGTNFEVGYVDLDIDGNGGEGNCVDGAQFLTATAPVGVLVGGVDWATSYGYPGGMSLRSLWVPPTEPPG